MVVLVIEEDGLLSIARLEVIVIEGVREFEAQRSCQLPDIIHTQMCYCKT